MNPVNEDLGQLIIKLESWVNRIPQEAQEFHRRRQALVQLIRGGTGVFGGRDAAQVADIVRQSTEMEGDLPSFELLVAAARRTRLKVIAFRATAAPDPKTRSLVEEWSGDWLSLIDFLVGHAADRKAAIKATSQIEQIETWAADRTRALLILSEASSIRVEDVGSGLKTAIDSAISYWTEDFAQGRTDSRWLEEATKTARTMYGGRVQEARNTPPPAAASDCPAANLGSAPTRAEADTPLDTAAAQTHGANTTTRRIQLRSRRHPRSPRQCPRRRLPSRFRQWSQPPVVAAASGPAAGGPGGAPDVFGRGAVGYPLLSH